jgi:hypothetical protein
VVVCEIPDQMAFLGIKIISQDYKETINWNFYAYLFKYRTSSECLIVPTQSILVKDSAE